MISALYDTSKNLDEAKAPRDFDPEYATAAYWVGEIKKAWAKGPAGTLELARVVAAARNAFPHGGWSALWKSGKMPFAKRTGYLLIVIGNGLGWANVHVCAHLPAALRTLSHVARLDRMTLERLIQEGEIHPALKEAEARELVARFRGMSVAVKSRKLSVQQWLRRCHEFVGANLKCWQPSDRDLAAKGLTRLIGEIRAAGGIAPNGNSQNLITPCDLLIDQQNYHP